MSRSPRILVAGLACFALGLAACTNTETEGASGSTTTLPDTAADPAGTSAGETDSVAEQDEGAAEQEPPPELSELTGNILVRNDRGQIVVVDPTGAGAVTLSNEDGSDHTQPTWSATGASVAWSSFGPDGAMLTVSDRTGGNTASLEVISPAFYLSWSEGDEWIGGLRPTPTGMEMFVADGEVAGEQFVSDSQPFYFEWAGGDSLVAAVASQFLVDITPGENVTRVARPLDSALGAFQAPAILENGDLLAALNVGGTNTLSRISGLTHTPVASTNAPMLFSVSPNGGEVAVLVPATPAQQAESQEIAFQLDQTAQGDETLTLDTGQITIIDLASGEVTELPNPRAVAMSWSPDGETLAVLRATGANFEWTFTRDGETTSGSSFVPSQRYTQSYLPFFDQYNLSSTPWSPDSSAITFAGTVGNEAGVFVDVVDDELGPARITSGEIAFWSPN